MGEVKWIKVSTDMFSNNRKIKQIELMPEGDAILVIWLKLMLLAGNINDGGAIYLTPEIPYTDEMLANELRRPLTTVRLALSVFERFGMIEIIDDILMLSSWEKYQSTDRLAEIREYNRLAKQRSREKQKQLEIVNDKSMTSQRCHDTEEDIEEDEEKEEEFHSFNHSNARESEFEEDNPVENSTDRESVRLKYLGGKLGKGVVMLSDEQLSDLLDKLSVEEFDKYVSIVADCELSGQHYKKKTHYQAILEMARKDRKLKGGKSN